MSYPSLKFSIIISTYNAEEFLETCLLSIIKQKYDEKEIIIQDGGSTDRTIEIIKRFEKYVKYWESAPDEGIYDAWNKALNHCSGDWMYFIGADDKFYDYEVLNSVAAGVNSTSSKIIYGKLIYYNPHNPNELRLFKKTWQKTKRPFRRKMAIPHQSIFHHKSLFENTKFDARFRISGDYDFLMYYLKNNNPYFLSDIIIAYMSCIGLSGNYQNAQKILKEEYLVQVKHGIKWAKIIYIIRTIKLKLSNFF